MAIIDRISPPSLLRLLLSRFLMKSKQFAIMYPMSVHALSCRNFATPHIQKRPLIAVSSAQPFSPLRGENVIGNYIICQGEGRGKRKLDRHLLCTQCQHIGEVDGGGIAIACNSISFFDFAFRIFIIFKPNICDFAAFRYTRSWGRTGSREGVNRWGQLKLSMLRAESLSLLLEHFQLPSGWSAKFEK